MKPDKILKTKKEKNINIPNIKLFNQSCNLNQILIEKIKKLKREKGSSNVIFDYFHKNERITTSSYKNQENSKTNNSHNFNFNNYNLSNLNNIRRIYLRNNNYFSTEIDHKYFNKSYNNYCKEQNDNYKMKKYRNNKINIKRALEPIYEIYDPSKTNKYRNIYNNYINMNQKSDTDYIKPRHISPNGALRYKNKEYSKVHNFINYFPYIEKIKKIRANNSNDKIFINRKFNNSIPNIKLSLDNYSRNAHSVLNSYINNYPLNITPRNSIIKEDQNIYPLSNYIILDKTKERKYRSTHYIPKNNKKQIDNKNNTYKQLSLRKYFGDNYKYFERNESPNKKDRIFHKRRSPAHVFGWENFAILKDTNDRLIASSLAFTNKYKRLNSEGNGRNFDLINLREDNTTSFENNY